MKYDKKLQSIANCVLVLLCLSVILPLMILISSSLTDNTTLIQSGYNVWPAKFSLAAYEYLFETGSSIPRSYLISASLMVLGTALSIAIATPLAYTISRPGLPFKKLMTFLVFFTMLFNGGLVPSYINYVNVLHLKNTYWALLIPNLLMPAIYVLLMKSYFSTNVPEEILEAAEIDGASEFRRFLTIAVPLAKPIIATIALFVATGYWNDWQNGYIYLSKRTDLYSIQTLLNAMIRNIQFLTQNSYDAASSAEALASIPSVSVRMAIATIGVIPILLIYPFIQKNIVKGIALGGVKG